MTTHGLPPLAWFVVGLAGCYSPNQPITPDEGPGSTSPDSGADTSQTTDSEDVSTSGGSDLATSDVGSSTAPPQPSTDGDTSGTVEVDTTPPAVLAIAPESGALGVADDVSIVITFNEPMDRTATQAAWQSPNIGNVVMSWSGDDTELTIVPNALLEYATGDDVDSLDPREYTFTIDTTATDKAANPLAEPVPSNFYTLRLVVLRPAVIEGLTGVTYDGGGVAESDVFVGDLQGNTQQVGLLSFTLPALPAPVDSPLAAAVWADQTYLSGTPYGPFPALGEMHVAQVEFDEELDAFDTPTLDDLGVFADDASLETKMFDVTQSVANDYMQGRSMSQFRLEFPTATNGNGAVDRVTFERESVGMELSYLIQ